MLHALAAEITNTLSIPTIGAGHACDAYVLVTHDLLGLLPTEPASFVKQYAKGFALFKHAITAFKADIESKQFIDIILTTIERLREYSVLKLFL